VPVRASASGVRGGPVRQGLETLAGRDPLLRYSLVARRLSPKGAALATLVIGFGVIASWFLFFAAQGDSSAVVRLVRRYPTGALGDSLILPLAGALTVRVLWDLADAISLAADADTTALRQAAGRLRATLASPAASWGPAVAGAAIVVWYHLPWLTDPGYWVFSGVASTFVRYGVGFYHGAFMVLVIWWLLAFVMRVVLVGARLFPTAAREGGFAQGFADQAAATSRHFLYLVGALTLFVALLYFDRFGLTFSWRVVTSDPPTLLSLALVPPVWAGLAWFALGWVAPLRRGP
jgi:hypothetical protein